MTREEKHVWYDCLKRLPYTFCRQKPIGKYIVDFFCAEAALVTGKTYTIAKLCKKLVENGNKIFITGPTHTAINNCLIALSNELEDKTKVIKVGEKYQASEILDNPNITRKTRLKYVSYVADPNYSHSGIAIGATPFALCYHY